MLVWRRRQVYTEPEENMAKELGPIKHTPIHRNFWITNPRRRPI